MVRMGGAQLLDDGAADVPALQVFIDQEQTDPKRSFIVTHGVSVTVVIIEIGDHGTILKDLLVTVTILGESGWCLKVHCDVFRCYLLAGQCIIGLLPPAKCAERFIRLCDLTIFHTSSLTFCLGIRCSYCNITVTGVMQERRGTKKEKSRTAEDPSGRARDLL